MKDKQNMALGLFVLLFIVVLFMSDSNASSSTEVCIEITPGVFKCTSSDGSTRTLINM